VPTLKVNDLEMFYSEHGDGPPLVALHAATADSVLMGWLVSPLKELGFNVITPDLRGHGKTANPAADLHLPRLVDDLLEFLFRLGRTPVHGLGYSMGGGVLLYAAKKQPDLFRSLALLGTNYRHAPAERVAKVLGPPERREGLIREVFDPQHGIAVGWDAEADAFQSIAAPTLIMCADHDEFNDIEDSVKLFHAMPRSEVLVVPHADHLGLVRHPMVLEAMRDFYSRIRK
jgi:pimeloyl-ACP methyl ester carboxylesterase